MKDLYMLRPRYSSVPDGTPEMTLKRSTSTNRKRALAQTVSTTSVKALAKRRGL